MRLEEPHVPGPPERLPRPGLECGHLVGPHHVGMEHVSLTLAEALADCVAGPFRPALLAAADPVLGAALITILADPSSSSSFPASLVVRALASIDDDAVLHAVGATDGRHAVHWALTGRVAALDFPPAVTATGAALAAAADAGGVTALVTALDAIEATNVEDVDWPAVCAFARDLPDGADQGVLYSHMARRLDASTLVAIDAIAGRVPGLDFAAVAALAPRPPSSVAVAVLAAWQGPVTVALANVVIAHPDAAFALHPSAVTDAAAAVLVASPIHDVRLLSFTADLVDVATAIAAFDDSSVEQRCELVLRARRSEVADALLSRFEATTDNLFFWSKYGVPDLAGRWPQLSSRARLVCLRAATGIEVFDWLHGQLFGGPRAGEAEAFARLVCDASSATFVDAEMSLDHASTLTSPAAPGVSVFIDAVLDHCVGVFQLSPWWQHPNPVTVAVAARLTDAFGEDVTAWQTFVAMAPEWGATLEELVSTVADLEPRRA